jgi:sulfoxide reductase heme-binding subunit YedZ
VSTPFPIHRLKPLVFLAALTPLVLLIAGLADIAGFALGPNPIREMLHVSGKTSLNLLLITLTISPLRELTRNPQWLPLRRPLGLFAFFYAALHFLIYVVLELDLDFSDLGREIIKRPYIIVGTLALLAMLPLAATSTARMMRRLGKRWTQLHYLIYPITALGIWHYYWQVKADITEPLFYAAGLALLLALRSKRWMR